MALEDAPAAEACADAWDDIRTEPGQFALFLLMRLLLPMAAGIAAMIVLLIPTLVLVLVGLATGVTVRTLAQSNDLLLLFAIPAVILFVLFFLGLGISIGGTIGTFNRNYATLFYAVRYRALGQRLWPAPEPPPVLPQAPPLPG
jgi:hypothetical protein